MEEEKLEQLRANWYSSEPVMFEIVKCLKDRETTFIGNFVMRNIKAHAIRYLESNMNRFHFLKDKMNLYNSLSMFYGMPMFSYNKEERKKQQLEWNEGFRNSMIGYDFLFDIDCDFNPKFSYATTWKVKEIFDRYNIRYYLLFSAGKNNGFHIRVSYEDFPEWMKKMDWDKLCDMIKRFAFRFKAIEGLEFIDDSIFDLRRVAKCPYSCVYPYFRIALPLSDEQFTNFDLNKMTLQYWTKHIEEIRNRGLLKREGDPENFGRLIKDYLRD
jgi:hypothetical protein